MKTIYSKILAMVTLIIVSSCNLDDIESPNAPTVDSFLNDASEADVKLLAVGLEAVMRNDLEFHYQTVSIIGREYLDLTQVDPRYTGELLKGPLDNNGFLTTRAFAAWYKIVQSANLLITAVENSAVGFSDETKNGYYGYANTMKAYALMMVANRQWTNGIRVDVGDGNNLGVFVTYEDALVEVMALLNTANTQLGSADPELGFALSDGFGETGVMVLVGEQMEKETFLMTSGFAKFNRAIAARVAIYQGEKSMALTLLNNSFFDMTADLAIGTHHIFGSGGNDIMNAQFYIPNQDRYMAHDSFVADAEMGDNRLSKVQLFDPEDDPDEGPVTVSFDGLSADYQVVIYSSNTSPIDIVRNEELVLLYAEANIGTNNAEAVAALNVIRNAAGLAAYSGGMTDTKLETEMLAQRRYSLFGEGHRWIDLRRLGRIGEIPLDRAGDNALDAFPTPVTEGGGL